MLFADATDEAEATVATEEIPTEVVAMDGVASPDEAHNAERPARKELKKKRPPKGKPLSEFAVGSTVKAVVKSVASYGAFCDFGASSDGLLHISRMSKEYVGDVSEVLSVGQEVEVRIVEIDEQKNQIALSLLTEAEEGEAKAAQNKSSQESIVMRGLLVKRLGQNIVVFLLRTYLIFSTTTCKNKMVLLPRTEDFLIPFWIRPII